MKKFNRIYNIQHKFDLTNYVILGVKYFILFECIEQFQIKL